MNKETEKQELFYLLYPWRKLIGLSVLISMLCGVVITMPLFMPPTYKSEAIIYPPASYSDKIIAQYDLRFGADKEIDEHIQILRSSILRDSIVNKYRLMAHYEIEKDDPYKFNKLYKLYEENITIERTRFNAISIIVIDTDPLMAAKICNDIVRIGDQVKAIILKQNLQQTVFNLEGSIANTLKDLNAISEAVTRSAPPIKLNYANLLKQTNAERFKMQLELTAIIDRYRTTKNSSLLQMLTAYETKLLQLNSLKDSYEQANISLSGRIANSYIITPAEVADKKFAPKRSVIILLFGIAGILLSVITVIGLDRYKNFKRSLP